jgi:hypothetical protein
VPIPPEFDLEALVQKSTNFNHAPRISIEKLKDYPSQHFEALVLNRVIREGKPLVIEGWEKRLSPQHFSRSWLEENMGTKSE